MSEYFAFYCESNIVCFIIFGIFLAHDLLSLDRQERQIKYDNALVAFMAYFLSDSLWAAVDSGVITPTRFWVVLTNLLNYILMAAVTYGWLEYVMAVEQAPHRNRRINKFAVVFPFIVSSIALVLTYIIAPHKLLSDTLEVQPLYSFFLIAVPDINIIAVLFYTVRKAKDEVNPIEKKKHLYIGLFPLVIVAGGLVQLVWLPHTSIFSYSCTFLMLMIYIQGMENLISIDPLTNLNNRAQLYRYTSQKGNIYVEDRMTYVMMIDANDFKLINDTWGHAEGDRALRIIAVSLKAAVKSRNMPLFLGRYGGDEFILILHPDAAEEVDVLAAAIRSNLEGSCRENETPYMLSVGIGYDKLMDENDNIQNCMRRADHKLYLDKENCKRNGQRTGER